MASKPKASGTATVVAALAGANDSIAAARARHAEIVNLLDPESTTGLAAQYDAKLEEQTAPIVETLNEWWNGEVESLETEMAEIESALQGAGVPVTLPTKRRKRTGGRRSSRGSNARSSNPITLQDAICVIMKRLKATRDNPATPSAIEAEMNGVYATNAANLGVQISQALAKLTDAKLTSKVSRGHYALNKKGEAAAAAAEKVLKNPPSDD